MASASDVALQAAMDGNLRLLKMMASEVNLREAKDDKGRNALHLAAEKGHHEVCRFLVEESGLDVDSVPVRGHGTAVRLLMSKGIDVNVISYCGTPLLLAAFKDQSQTVKILLEHGADPNKAVCQLFTPLLMACCAHSLKCMKLLVEAGVDVNLFGPLILMCAVHHGVTDIVKFLLEAGADPNISDKDKGLQIMWVAVHGLFNSCDDPVMPDPLDSMPPHDTTDEVHCDGRSTSLSKGLDVDTISSCGTPLHMAASRDQDEILKILLEHCADPNKVIFEYFPPLLMACRGRSLKCMKLLVEAGADVNFISPSGPIILMMAVQHDLTDIVKFLLEAGADPNIPDEKGRILITWAAIHGKRELVELLFPRTKPIPIHTDWSVDGLIRSMKLRFLDKVSQGAFLEKELLADPKAFLEKELLADPKSGGKEAFVNGRYFEALYLYGMAANKDPLDATLFANMSICWLRLGDGEEALSDARKCKMMRPGWSKAWYREGAALSFLKDYKGAVNAFKQALELDPSNDEIKKALREATEAMRSAARSG